MPRKQRLVIPEFPHHVTHRGNNRQRIFIDEQDFSVYVGYIRERALEDSLRVLAYCLMPNHVHMVATPATAHSLSSCVGAAHRRYARYFNAKHGRSGHVWEGRFYSCVLAPGRVEVTVRYVERNPVRARMVALAWEYAWSSAHAHTSGRDQSGLLDMDYWREHWDADRWRDTLMGEEEESALGDLRAATRTGRPCGSPPFIRQMLTSEEHRSPQGS